MATTTTLPSTTQSRLTLPVCIRGANLQDLSHLGTDSPRLTEHLTSCAERLRYMAECQAKFNHSERVTELELALRDVIDSQHDLVALKDAIKAVAQDHLYRGSAIDPAVAIFERTEVQKVNWRDGSDLVKYSRDPIFDEFKRGVFDIEHPDDDFPGIESFFQERNARAHDEDDLEMTYHTKRSLKCPITMMTFQHPMRSKVCVHVFSKHAITEMLKRNGGVIDCPVAGCDKQLTEDYLERDRVMERRVREEEEDERVGEELSSEVGNDHVLDIL